MKRLLFAILLLLFSQKSGAASVPESLLEMCVRAIGGRENLQKVHSVYVRWDVETGGLKGLADIYSTETGDHKEDTKFDDVYSSLTVFDARQMKSWSRDQAGKVQELKGAELEAQVTSAYIDSYSFLFSSRMSGEVTSGKENESYNVLQLLPRGGKPVTVYLDKQTHLPAKQEMQEGDRLVTTTFDEWRDVEGILIAHQLQQTTGDPKYDVHLKLKEIRFNLPADQMTFQRPEEGAPDFHFATGNSALRIPFELTSNHIYVRGQVDDFPVWFLLDTGADFAVINASRAREFGISLEGKLEARGAGEKSSELSLAKNLSFRLPGVVVVKQTAAAIPLNEIETREGRHMDGILGYDFISRFVVEVDYAARVLNLYDPKGYEYSGKGVIVPITVESNTPVVQGTVVMKENSKPLQTKISIDTGSRTALDLSSPFHESFGLTTEIPTLDVVWGFGVGGQVKTKVGKIHNLQIGSVSMTDVLVGFSQDKKGAFANPEIGGNLGGEFLRRFRVIFDYSRNRMILEPNADFQEPFEFDMSGMSLATIDQNFHRFQVVYVIENSPAAAAGIQAGDTILEVNGKNASDYTLEELRSLFRSEQRNCKLLVSRATQQLKVTFRTRRLI